MKNKENKVIKEKSKSDKKTSSIKNFCIYNAFTYGICIMFNMYLLCCCNNSKIIMLIHK